MWPYGGNGNILVESGLNSFYNVLITNPVRVDYTSQDLLVARLGGLVNMLIPSTDDDGTGNVDTTILANILSNVTTDIDGALGTIYPIPFVRRGTVALVQVLAVSTTGVVTSIQMVPSQLGYYKVAPATSQTPVYAYPSADLTNRAGFYTSPWPWSVGSACWAQAGVGLTLTVAYTQATTNDKQFSVTGTPAIANGGTGYVVGDIVALTGGASFVPNKVSNAALDMVCESLYTRRLSPSETNIFTKPADRWKEELAKIGNGFGELDALYPRLFTPGAAWVTYSKLNTDSL